MPNATVRANARTLPEPTTRRAALVSIIAAGAVGATAALPAHATTELPALSAVDRRVLDLWRRRAKLVAFCNGLDEQIEAAKAQMPRWARGGPKYRLAKGEIELPDELARHYVGWPEVANLDQQPVDVLGQIIARPRVEDLYAQFFNPAKAGRKQATQLFLQALLAHDKRVKEQKAEQERTGYSRLNARQVATTDKIGDIMAAIEEKAEISTLALAAHTIFLIELNDEEDYVLRTFRATLVAIRPQLVGEIAEDADRMLAQGGEARA
jgi:hypothetical protein